MTAADVTGNTEVGSRRLLRLQSRHGPPHAEAAAIYLAIWLNGVEDMDHVHAFDPQTQGKIERWHQTSAILLENYYLRR